MDTYFNAKFNKILSLGANCYPKFFISKVLKPSYGKTELFDYIGTAMWSINALLLNDFKDLYNPDLFEIRQTMAGHEKVVMNSKYYVRFLHDLKSVEDSKSAEFRDKMQRRIERFKINMAFDKILFIRIQEDQAGRLPYDGASKRSEIEELDEFIDILKIKYDCKSVTIIYINLDTDGWNQRRDILSVKINALEFYSAHTVINDLFLEKDVVGQLERQ